MRPFKSDGCTLWFDGFWVDCCYDHDQDYYHGGSKEDRKKSDQKLRQCVYDKVIKKGYSKLSAAALSWSMYIGVRIGGMPWLPLLNARWGYKREYKLGNLGYERD